MQHQYYWHRIYSTLAAIALLSVFAFGQSTSSVRGIVTDAQSGTIAGAVVTLTSLESGLTRTTTSDTTGSYQFLQVLPGSYKLRVEKSGYKGWLQESVRLQVNTPETVNAALEVGQLTDTLTITSESAPLNTTDATVGNTFNEKQVRQLPLLTRNVVELLSLQPGVSEGGQVLGGKSDQNNVTLDGVDANDQASPGPFESVLPVPLDSVQEFRVTIAGVNADQGRSGGGQVALVTRSGTNDLHASAYWFHRNTVTSANEFFNKVNGVKRPSLLRNQYGVAAGGPIWKNKAFLFFNFEGRRDAKAQGGFQRVPSEDMKNGIVKFTDSAGNLQTLSTADVRTVDPKGIGASSAMLAYLRSYPVGNAASQGSDGGLNFSGFQFNAPVPVDDKAYVARFDYNFNANHTMYWRGTLADNSSVTRPQRIPTEDALQSIIDNSRGFAAQYTATLTPSLINTFTWGFTRQGFEATGVNGPFLQVNGIQGGGIPRPSSRTAPVHNLINTTTWLKGSHQVQFGLNFRLATINNTSVSYPNYRIERATFDGVANELVTNVNRLIQQRSGNSALTVSSASNFPVKWALLALYGSISDAFITYNFDKTGKPIAIGTPFTRSYVANEYEYFAQDTWKVRSNLTLTYGLRYGYYPPPYEKGGNQVQTSVPLMQALAQRVQAANSGQASNLSPGLTYQLAGKANGQTSWYAPDKNNFSPRLSIAWSPNFTGGWLGKLTGGAGRSVIRAGAGVVFDRFATAMVLGNAAPGVATQVGLGNSYTVADAPRFNGTFPTGATPPSGSFPFTPPTNRAVSTIVDGLDSRIRNPYTYLFNFSMARDLPGNLNLEVGYLGRYSRKLASTLDAAQVMLNYKDQRSGTTLLDALIFARNQTDTGVTTDQIEANPARIALNPFLENIMPGLRNAFIPGSASANFVYGLVDNGIDNELDYLHVIDRVRCAAVSGCNTFFQSQYSFMPTWTNAANANYNALFVTLRKRFSAGLVADFNYTWSKSIDMGSGPASGDKGLAGAFILNIYNPGQWRAVSNFDIRHQVNANFVWDLPLGKGRSFAGNAPMWMNQFIGGWQLAGIVRARSGLPVTVRSDFVYATNYWVDPYAMSRGEDIPAQRQDGTYGNVKLPSLFANAAAGSSLFRNMRPGESGLRNPIRGDKLINLDAALSKAFALPWEGHTVSFRAEAFNVTNSVFFQGVNVALYDPRNFGQLGSPVAPRQMQFSLRYSF